MKKIIVCLFGITLGNISYAQSDFLALDVESTDITHSETGGSALSPYDGAFDDASEITVDISAKNTDGDTDIAIDVMASGIQFYATASDEAVGSGLALGSEQLLTYQFPNDPDKRSQVTANIDISSLDSTITNQIEKGDYVTYKLRIVEQNPAGDSTQLVNYSTLYAFDSDCIQTTDKIFCVPITIERLNELNTVPSPTHTYNKKESSTDWVTISHGENGMSLDDDVVGPVEFCAGLKINNKAMRLPSSNDILALKSWLDSDSSDLTTYAWPVEVNYISSTPSNDPIAPYTAVYMNPNPPDGTTYGGVYNVYDSSTQYVMCVQDTV
ncbi:MULTISPECIES: hypothetical protein [Cysteiniphilum]|uniref:hypothetical protein n=1 Tax=Cysteiniphilum TaxID=2056696 RepID=UPI0017852B6F|nr:MULTISPECIES: hypothetical protein [Cysteiniphilum]